MNQKVVHLCLAGLMAVMFAAGAPFASVHAQGTTNSQDLPQRDQAYMRNLVDLSGVIGGAHAIRVACNGVDDQFWRSYMQQLLGLEAPTRSRLRSSMVDAFNRAYQVQQNQNRFCDDAAKAREVELADRGQQISEALAAHYFPKR